MLREELEMAVDEKNKHPRHSADVVSFNPLHNKPFSKSRVIHSKFVSQVTFPGRHWVTMGNNSAWYHDSDNGGEAGSERSSTVSTPNHQLCPGSS